LIKIAVDKHATFNMRENTVTLVGNVVVTRGSNVLRGQRLVVDLTVATVCIVPSVYCLNADFFERANKGWRFRDVSPEWGRAG
jgi:hypothetical protein